MKEPIMVTVYCVVVRGGEVLLSEDEGKPGWKLPGGEVERGELLLETAVREVREETGYDVEPTGVINIQEYLKKDGTHRLRIYLTADFKGGQKKLMSGEVKKIRWFPKEELRVLRREDFYLEPYYLAIKDYLEGKVYPRSLIRKLAGKTSPNIVHGPQSQTFRLLPQSKD